MSEPAEKLDFQAMGANQEFHAVRRKMKQRAYLYLALALAIFWLGFYVGDFADPWAWYIFPSFVTWAVIVASLVINGICLIQEAR